MEIMDKFGTLHSFDNLYWNIEKGRLDLYSDDGMTDLIIQFAEYSWFRTGA